MDGAAYASQCPIPKYSTFKYVFKAEYEGSYWYHSHNGIQRMDGLFGGLTIYDPGSHNYFFVEFWKWNIKFKATLDSPLTFFKQTKIQMLPTFL